MKCDFTVNIYHSLLKSFLDNGYAIISFEDYLINDPGTPFVILRHDVDKKPENALITAKIERDYGIRSSYYFRIVKSSNDPEVIRKIASLGHEIGYHYEDYSIAGGNAKKAIRQFTDNLEYFRRFYPVRTICMHGSPMSRYDNRTIWNFLSFETFGIIGEPYYTIDFTQVQYLTDTGRRWNGEKVSIRDKVDDRFRGNYRSTYDIIQAITDRKLHSRLMITVHPQRWNPIGVEWAIEYAGQNIKNQIKRLLLSFSK